MIHITPSQGEFKTLAKEHNLIVFSCKFYADWLTPLSIYYGLSQESKGESFLLESVEGEEKICRYSFLGFKPLYVFKSKGNTIILRGGGRQKKFTTDKDPLFHLKKIMDGFRLAPMGTLRFFGGFVGYAGYDLIHFYEPVGPPLPDPLKTPDTYFILPQYLIIFDHLKQEVEVLSFVVLGSKKGVGKVYEQEKKKLEALYKKMITPQKLAPLAVPSQREHLVQKLRWDANFKKKDFLAAVRKARQYIKEGEIIQTVLSQRFSLPFSKDPFSVYRYLRILNPSPYMFYLNFGEVQLCGASPEMLLRCEEGTLITRPIAGTRKRGKDENEDSALELSLISDPKERAEHIMLVDLARNDLGRVARQATVKIPLFMTVERFSHVMHIVSEVRARLKGGEDIVSALVSCFPAGTVSGAPKVRAMQIINELEPDKRGIYAGCVGYFSFTKSLDTCIIIRTIVFKNKKAYIQAGAGIVYDSVPQREYMETVNKAKAQMLAVKLAS